MTAILGISGYYHDSAAALLVDGELVAAAQEERFSRRKHDARFPAEAARYCLITAGLEAADLDAVAFYEKPLRKFDRLLESWVSGAPRGFAAFSAALPVWLRQKLFLARDIRQQLGGGYRRRIIWPEHHQSHAASAFFPSPFEQAAILTIDGTGEWATGSWGVGRGHQIELRAEQRFPHSLGLLYSAFTAYCGFQVNSGEYKLMGLAPYGEPRYAELIREHLIDLKPDGSLRLDMRYFDFIHRLRMTSRRFDSLFGGPARLPEGPLTQREMDLAASIQRVAEEAVLAMARHIHRQTGLPNLCLAGGVALNCVANGRLLREGPFERLWIQPAAGDAGGALGAALLVWHQLRGAPRTPTLPDGQRASLLGPEFTAAEIRQRLGRTPAVFETIEDEDALVARAAELLASGQVVGWFQGRMEFGPRALGNRSILGDPRDPTMQRVMNLKIKFRESFRPFAPSVLRDEAAALFEIAAEVESPYMLMTARLQAAQRLPDDGIVRQGLSKLDRPRSLLPAVTHVDDSARLQTVDRQRNPRYYKLLEAFAARTGCPALINTSFNVRGEPIVCTPEDAYRCFLATGMDALFLGEHLLLKSDQPDQAPFDITAHLDRYGVD